jgi:hypothetical protein
MNMAVVGGIFVLGALFVALVFSWLFPGTFLLVLLIDAIGLGVAYYFYTLSENEPIRFCCPKCTKIVLSNSPWFCAECEKPNRNANDFPFVFKCEHCGAEPKAYKCHHRENGVDCGEMIFLSDDEDATNYAYRLNFSSEAPEPDQHAEKMKKMGETKQEKLAKRDIALVDAQLKSIRKRMRAERQKKKTAKEILEEGVGSDMELEDAEAELKALYAEKYKDNPQLLRRMNAALKANVARQKSEGM